MWTNEEEQHELVLLAELRVREAQAHEVLVELLVLLAAARLVRVRRAVRGRVAALLLQGIHSASLRHLTRRRVPRQRQLHTIRINGTMLK